MLLGCSASRASAVLALSIHQLHLTSYKIPNKASYLSSTSRDLCNIDDALARIKCSFRVLLTVGLAAGLAAGSAIGGLVEGAGAI